MAEVPLFTTDVGKHPPAEGVSGSKAALVLLLLAVGVGLGLYLGPRSSKTVSTTVQKVRELVKSIQAAITKTPEKAEETAQAETPDPPRKHSNRPAAMPAKGNENADGPGILSSSREAPFLFPAAPAVVPFGPQATNVRPGTERARLLELYGHPDLKISFLDRGSLVEQYTWLDKTLASATNVSLKNGRVVEVRRNAPGSVIVANAQRPARPDAASGPSRRARPSRYAR